MARVIILSTQSVLDHLFTVGHSVGLHGVNHPNDVLLVQFFLRALIQTPLGTPAIPVDGNCGSQTIDWIRYFQTAYGHGGSGVREAGQRGGDQNNLKQIGVATPNADGSVRFVSGPISNQNNLKQIGLAAHNADGSVRSAGGNSPGVSDIKDGTSNTISFGERPPAAANPHVQRHYGTVRPAHIGEPYETNMTIVRLNLAYRDAFGQDRFKRIDLDPLFPRELFSALYGVLHGRDFVREAAPRSGNLGQILPTFE